MNERAGGSGKSADPAVRALAQAFRQGQVALHPGRVLFLRACAPDALHGLLEPDWVHVQSYRPDAMALERLGMDVRTEAPEGRLANVLVLPTRQRDEARALLACALTHLEPGGQVVAAVSNSEGARSVETDLARLAGRVEQYSKHKSRVFWASPGAGDVDAGLLGAWLQLDAERPILGGRYVSRPGLFAWDHVDPASALLAAHLPRDLHGRVADLGAGWGYLATRVLEDCPKVRALDLYEAEARALPPARKNIDRALEACGRSVDIALHWHDVTLGLPSSYHAIVSNPPFHVGRPDVPELGRAFIRTAAGALVPRGRLFLVANRHLPYESTLQGHFESVRVRADAHGFKVFEAVRGSAS